MSSNCIFCNREVMKNEPIKGGKSREIRCQSCKGYLIDAYSYDLITGSIETNQPFPINNKLLLKKGTINKDYIISERSKGNEAPLIFWTLACRDKECLPSTEHPVKYIDDES